jgi:hypothetical protein
MDGLFAESAPAPDEVIKNPNVSSLEKSSNR